MMTEKDFLDVFPQLKVDPELESLLGEVKVMKVSINPQKDCLRVYVLSRQWIHKKHIYHLEETIKEQFFANAPLRVKIIEKFQLSSQYTPENFLDVYRQSILLELKQYSALEYNMFYTAEITFSDPETMELVMTDSVVARDREHELVRVLEKIFCERCGFNLKVHPAYRKPVESKGRKNSELRILEEARQILLHSKVGNKNSDREAGELSFLNTFSCLRSFLLLDSPFPFDLSLKIITVRFVHNNWSKIHSKMPFFRKNH